MAERGEELIATGAKLPKFAPARAGHECAAGAARRTAEAGVPRSPAKRPRQNIRRGHGRVRAGGLGGRRGRPAKSRGWRQPGTPPQATISGEG